MTFARYSETLNSCTANEQRNDSKSLRNRFPFPSSTAHHNREPKL